MITQTPWGIAPVEFPPPPLSRPWISANMIASRNGIVAWTPRAPGDSAVRVIAGPDPERPGRVADRVLMGYLRACADAVGIGAQTLRDEPSLVLRPDALPGPGREAIAAWRTAQGRRPTPLQVLYSASGAVDLAGPMFTSADLTAIVVTTAAGARRLRAHGSDARGVIVIVAGEDAISARAFALAHEQLARDHGVRYLECEGGARLLHALHAVGLLDEVFVTVTDVDVDATDRAGVRRIFTFEEEGATLISERRVPGDDGYVFRRWRFTRVPS